MKEFYSSIIFIFILLLILFKIDSAANHNKLLEQYESNRLDYQRKIENLEKEIRLLNQDIYILQYGYENNN